MEFVDDDCVQRILQFCDITELSNVAQVSRRCRTLARREIRTRKLDVDGDVGNYLHVAAKHVDVKIAEIALEAGVDPDELTKNRRLSPLAYLLRHSRGGEQREALVGLLAEAGADLIAPVGDRAHCSPLHVAAFEADLQVVRALLRAKVPANAVNRLGQTPLHLASRRRRMHTVEVIHELIDAGADLEARTESGSHALHYGVLSRNASIVNALVSRGARTFVLDQQGLTPVDRATSLRCTSLRHIILRSRPQGVRQAQAVHVRSRLGAVA